MSTFTQKWPAASIPAPLLELVPRKNPTSGGSNEIDANEPMATPIGPSLVAAVTTVTPVGKWPRTLSIVAWVDVVLIGCWLVHDGKA